MITYEEQNNLIKKTSILSIVIGILLTSIKLAAYFFTNSFAIMASLLDSAMDLLISVINYIVALYAIKPKDNEYHFGHNAIEDLSGLAQSCFVIGSVVLIILQCVQKLINKEITAIGDYNNIGILIICISIVLLIILILYHKYTIRKTDSLIIKANYIHYTIDLIVNTILLFALIFMKYTKLYFIDSAIAIIACLFIIRASYKIGKEALGNLMFKKLPFELENQIILAIKEQMLLDKNILGYHDLKTRKTGRIKFVQLHLEINRDISFKEAHIITELIEQMIVNKLGNCEIIIHQDPV